MNLSSEEAQWFESIGRRLRAERKKRKVSAQALAESIQISRITLNRLERGEPTVAVGVIIKVMTSLGLENQLAKFSKSNSQNDTSLLIPAQICLNEFPELKNLSWHVQGTEYLKPYEAFQIYERNGRHLDSANLNDKEKHLIKALRLAFEGVTIHV